MRQLNTKDLMRLSRILKKMNLNLKPDSSNTALFSIQLIKEFFENIHLAENDVYEFFANLTSKTVKELEDMEMTEFQKLLVEFQKLEAIKSFFQLLGQSMSTNSEIPVTKDIIQPSS